MKIKKINNTGFLFYSLIIVLVTVLISTYFLNNISLFETKNNIVFAVENENCRDCENCEDCLNKVSNEYYNFENNTENSISTMAPTNHIVKSGDTMWKIAVRYEIGLAELIRANPHIKNTALIYVGQQIYIPETTPLKSLEDEVIRLVNVQRVNAGLQPLKYNWEAARVARIKSQDMINNKYFAHISPVYGSPFKMLEDYGLRFSAAAENIAKGQTSAAQVMNSWMNSDGHRANILGKSFTDIGVGAAKDANGTITWTQLFLKPV